MVLVLLFCGATAVMVFFGSFSVVLLMWWSYMVLVLLFCGATGAMVFCGATAAMVVSHISTDPFPPVMWPLGQCSVESVG